MGNRSVAIKLFNTYNCCDFVVRFRHLMLYRELVAGRCVEETVRRALARVQVGRGVCVSEEE